LSDLYAREWVDPLKNDRSLLFVFLMLTAMLVGCPSAADDDDATTPLVVCQGSFEVDATDTAGDLVALADCQEITGDLTVIATALTDLSALSALTTVGGDLYIGDNTALTDLSALSALTTVGGDLYIGDNTALTQIDGLSALTTVGGGLLLFENAALTQVDGLSALTTVGYLSITHSAALTQVDGLSALTTVETNLHIMDNDALTQVDGLSALIDVVGNLTIGSNPALCSDSVDTIVASCTIGGTANTFGNMGSCP
jgi:hypothetical protein